MSTTAALSTGQHSYPGSTERTILVLTAISASLLQLIDTSIVNVSLREIAGSIGATNTEIAWAVTSYAVSNVIMIPLSGMLGDLFGRKNYFTASILLFTVASVFCGTSNTLWSLVLWRFIQGLGGGALLTTSQTIIVEAFPPEKVATANAIFGVGVILGPTFGPTLGGFLTDNYSWHWIFFINIPIGITAAIMSWTFVKNRIGAMRPSKIDWTGIVFLILAVGSLQYVLEEGTSEDWFESTTILIMSIVATIGFVGFIYWEWTEAQPAVNIRLMKNRNMWLGSMLGFVIGMILLATVFVFPSFVQIGLGWTATMTGNFMISGALASAVSMIVVSQLLNRGGWSKAADADWRRHGVLFCRHNEFFFPGFYFQQFFLAVHSARFWYWVHAVADDEPVAARLERIGSWAGSWFEQHGAPIGWHDRHCRYERVADSSQCLQLQRVIPEHQSVQPGFQRAFIHDDPGLYESGLLSRSGGTNGLPGPERHRHAAAIAG